MHPPYSLELAPSDYLVFLSKANDLAGEELATRETSKIRFMLVSLMTFNIPFVGLRLQIPLNTRKF